jgi:dTDP-4-dehydrorhamnose 3,5-epimerase
MPTITRDDVIDGAREKIYTQDYSPSVQIEGVQIIDIKSHVGDEGDFSEILRLDEKGELVTIPGFKLAQVNRTILFANSVKAWHVHFKQNEIWYLPPNHQLFVGLWDLRKSSSTANKTMRVNLGGGHSQLLFIPNGVAHGSANFMNRPVNLFYFVNEVFDAAQPDEQRLNWDAVGADFWKPVRD